MWGFDFDFWGSGCAEVIEQFCFADGEVCGGGDDVLLAEEMVDRFYVGGGDGLEGEAPAAVGLFVDG